MKKKKLPLKTLFILPSLDAGGAERVLITFMNGINRQKYDPVFLTVRKDGPLKNLIDPSIPFHTLNQKLTPLSLPALFWKIKKINPDVIISTMAHINFAVLALKPLFPDTIFVVREAITPSFLFQKHKVQSFMIKALYRKLYPKANFVLSPTQKTFDEFHYGLCMDDYNFILMKNPVNVSNIRSLAELPDISEQRKKTVHFVACGRLEKQKGFDRLISILDQFKTSYQWKLDILGEGDERPYLESIIQERGLQDNVFLKGLIMPPYSYFAEADCFLMPSRFEGLPNVVLESLACGTPVIATLESGGINEIVRDCPEESIFLVKNMMDFIKEMEAVKPTPKNSLQPSLLAECYNQETVFRYFEDTLDCSFCADLTAKCII